MMFPVADILFIKFNQKNFQKKILKNCLTFMVRAAPKNEIASKRVET